MNIKEDGSRMVDAGERRGSLFVGSLASDSGLLRMLRRAMSRLHSSDLVFVAFVAFVAFIVDLRHSLAMHYLFND